MNENEKLALIKSEIATDTEPRVPIVDKPEKEVEIEEWRNVIQDNFPGLPFAAETCASVISQLLINDITNPFGLTLIDAPSAGKTIVLNFFQECKEIVYVSDRFSPASFVSHAVNVGKKELAKIDLLPRIRHRTLVVRDLATLLSEREEDLTKSIGILTRVFDGEGFSSDSGVHGQRSYSGDYNFMLLAASTPIAPRVWNIMGNLGSRLYFLNINSKEKTENELALQLKGASCRQKELICRETTKNFINTLFSKNPNGIAWDSSQDPEECINIISRVAKLLAHLRAPINSFKERSTDDVIDYSAPLTEFPDRINQHLYNLARGHAVLCGRRQINMEDLKPVIEVAFCSANDKRVKTFKALLQNDGKLSTSKTIQELNCSKPTALREQQILKILKLVKSTNTEGHNEEHTIQLEEKFAWFLSDQCKELRGISIPITQGQIPFTEEERKANPTPYDDILSK